MPPEWLVKLFILTGANPIWLLTGRGSPCLAPSRTNEAYLNETWAELTASEAAEALLAVPGGPVPFPAAAPFSGSVSASAPASASWALMQDARQRASFLAVCTQAELLAELGRRVGLYPNR